MSGRIKYIDLCLGEMRVGFVDGRITSLSGGSANAVCRKYDAIDALRQRIGRLNQELDDAIEATQALDQWEPQGWEK